MTAGGAPSCPAGHGPMLLRTARQGRPAGRRFWSYPTCRHIVDAGEADDCGDGRAHADAQVAQSGPSLVAPGVFPCQVVAAAREPTGQVAFFQAAGLPEAVVGAEHLSDIDHAVVRCLAQWRLDDPLPRDAGADPGVRPVLAVAEAILTRGTTPFCSSGA